MKNFFKKIHFGAVAVLIGATLVLTQSAFTSAGTNRAHEEFGFLNGAWVKISSINTELYDYGCNDNPVDPYCRGYFDTAVNPTPQPTDTPLPSEPSERGDFYVTPK